MVTLAEVDKDIKIQVLNATDINGQAATIKSKLVGLGFENVTVGNASANATENSVQAKTKETASYFETSLGDFFAGEYTSDLKSSSTYDVVFTIGTDLSKSSSSIKTTITPTKTATATPTKKATTIPTESE
ncbi:hypothetical protein SDC9_143400 [bioreactor metagenome]|uniref:LytR/CpsA/Psr regulator C-terminal domain-containing protein n=1 Tax=bioreactor metagenome TaxID=1076179 RepID=A0A645E6Q9_9ZZZZ